MDAGFIGERKTRSIDWLILAPAVGIALLGLLTMSSFQAHDPFFIRQTVWIGISLAIFFAATRADWRLLRVSEVGVTVYGFALSLLLLLFLVAHAIKGAQSWFSFGLFAFEPIELADLALIIILAKYFSRRHTEIRNIRHIIVSGAYAFLVFALVALQPDFGGAVITFLIWLFMALAAGISRKHLVMIFAAGAIAFAVLWQFGFHDYQRQRIMTFLHPLANVTGAGYNAYQSMIAVGSGQVLGKGIGYGTQSKLRFLPEYQTDFIFAAYAEEWGFLGILLLFGLYGLLFWRLIMAAMRGGTNFETFFTLGVLFYLVAHFTLHVGINMGLLPVTGTTTPFMSYGGSHLVVEFLALGIVTGMRRYAGVTHRSELDREFSGGYDR